MPRAICDCGSAYPLTEEESRNLAGRPFVCPKCADTARPLNVPPPRPLKPVAKTAEKRQPQPARKRRESDVRTQPVEFKVPPALPPPPPPVRPIKAATPPPFPSPPAPQPVQVVVQHTRAGFFDDLSKLVTVVILIAGSAYGGWWLFSTGNDREVVALAKSLKQAVDGANHEVVPVKRIEPDVQPALQHRVPAGEVRGRGVVAQSLPAVVTIRTDRGSGSGFFTRDLRTIVTNYHVVSDSKSAYVVLNNDHSIEVAGYSALSIAHDLVVLQLKYAYHNGGMLDIDANLPDVGDHVWAIGAPKSLSGTASEGIIGSIRTEVELRKMRIKSAAQQHAADAIWIQTTAPISHGNSGGPLLLDSGKVAGVMSWTLPSGQNLNFAIAAQHIRDLLLQDQGEVKPLTELPQ